MSKRAEYLDQADQCQRMADRAKTPDVEERWLALAGKWLTFAGEMEPR